MMMWHILIGGSKSKSLQQVLDRI